MSEFQINAKCLEPDVTADTFWMGFYQQAQVWTFTWGEEDEDWCGRLSMVVLVLSWNPAWGAPSLSVGETEGFQDVSVPLLPSSVGEQPVPSVPSDYLCSMALWFKWEHPLLFMSHFKWSGFNSHWRTFWNKALFPQVDKRSVQRST